MSINALSSRAPLSKPNTFDTFQGQERVEDFDLGWYQFKFRNYDPTIARFFNTDPLSDKYVYNSPYAFAENKLGLGIELEGLELFQQRSRPKQESNGMIIHAQERAITVNPQISAAQLAPPKQNTTNTRTNQTFIGPAGGGLNEYAQRDIMSARRKEAQLQNLDSNLEPIMRGPAGMAASMRAAVGEGAMLATGEALIGQVGKVIRNAKGIISTPWGPAKQATTEAALIAKGEVEGGAKLFRIGTLGKSETVGAQFWSLENPAKFVDDMAAFAKQYGIPPENLANGTYFIEVGSLRNGARFVTRPAPAAGGNAGGAIEVVTNPSGVKLESFYMFK